MRFIISVVMNILLGFVSCLYLPWYTIAITAAIIAFIINIKAIISFLAAFAGIFILWFALSYWISMKNDHILAHKISLLILKTDSPFLLMVITAFIGALIAGMGALTGSYLKTLTTRSKDSIIADL